MGTSVCSYLFQSLLSLMGQHGQERCSPTKRHNEKRRKREIPTPAGSCQKSPGAMMQRIRRGSLQVEREREREREKDRPEEKAGPYAHPSILERSETTSGLSKLTKRSGQHGGMTSLSLSLSLSLYQEREDGEVLTCGETHNVHGEKESKGC